MTLSEQEWILLRDAFADIACWHMGFREGRPDYNAPPQLRELSDLMTKLKRRALEQTS